jgi:hypothetical protein
MSNDNTASVSEVCVTATPVFKGRNIPVWLPIARPSFIRAWSNTTNSLDITCITEQETTKSFTSYVRLTLQVHTTLLQFTAKLNNKTDMLLRDCKKSAHCAVPH